MSKKLNRYSSRITEPKSQGASQAMLYGTGLKSADMAKAEVGIVANWCEGNTCNMHLNDLAAKAKEGVLAAGLVGLRFNTIGVSDGISMGTEGMSYSLQSRDLIADSIETVMGAQWYDGLITIPGCDKNMPGCLIAMGRVNRPALMIYGGTIKPGHSKEGKVLDIISAFQSYGEFITGKLDETTRQDIVQHACPRRRCLRRHVHRQHHGLGDRGAWHVVALQFVHAGDGLRQGRGMSEGRCRGAAFARKRHQAA